MSSKIYKEIWLMFPSFQSILSKLWDQMWAETVKISNLSGVWTKLMHYICQKKKKNQEMHKKAEELQKGQCLEIKNVTFAYWECSNHWEENHKEWEKKILQVACMASN